MYTKYDGWTGNMATRVLSCIILRFLYGLFSCILVNFCIVSCIILSLFLSTPPELADLTDGVQSSDNWF